MPLWGAGGVASAFAGKVGADYASKVRSTDTGRNKSKKWGEALKWGADAATGLFPPLALVNAGRYGLTGETIGDSLAEDAGGPWGTAPPGPMIGAPGGTGGGGGGRSGRSSTATAAAEPPAEPAPGPTYGETEAEKRRKRIGRQQTIFRGRLGSPVDITKPTLLGS